MTSTDRVDLINIAMMLASCTLAFVAPFWAFLFAYAVLGPLHYFTQISWLHDRRYFVDEERTEPGRRFLFAWLALVGIAVGFMTWGVVAERLLHAPPVPTIEVGLVCTVFAVSAMAVARESIAGWLVAIVLLVFALAAFLGFGLHALFAFFLLNMIHVLVFTGAFLLHGALRHQGRYGLAAFAVFLACIGAVFVHAVPGAPPPEFVRRAYEPFTTLNAQLIRLFGFGEAASLREVLESPGGIAVMRLIAFAYTYHFLNWFTKTPVIAWHRVPRPRAVAIGLLWAASLALYAWDYVLGFLVTYAISVLHVLLELPLDHQTFARLARALPARIAPARPKAPVAAPMAAKRKARTRR